MVFVAIELPLKHFIKHPLDFCWSRALLNWFNFNQLVLYRRYSLVITVFFNTWLLFICFIAQNIHFISVKWLQKSIFPNKSFLSTITSGNCRCFAFLIFYFNLAFEILPLWNILRHLVNRYFIFNIFNRPRCQITNIYVRNSNRDVCFCFWHLRCRTWMVISFLYDLFLFDFIYSNF